MTKKLIAWLPTVVFISIILFMSFRPGPRLPHIKEIDKVIHAIAYCLLAILSYRSFFLSNFKKPALLAILLALAVGITDETLQYFNPRRTASLMDLVADVVGASAGAWAFVLLRSPRKGRLDAEKSDKRI